MYSKSGLNVSSISEVILQGKKHAEIQAESNVFLFIYLLQLVSLVLHVQ